MPIRVLLVVALFGVSGSAWADVVPQRKWLQVRSPHFTVKGEAGARDLRLVAERMEQLHAALGQMTKSDQIDTSDLTIVVFKTEAGFRPFQRRYQGKPVPVAGYFLPGPMNYIAILADRDYDYSDVVYHEYVHLVAQRALGSMPVWIGEAVAEFYGTFQPIDGGKKARIGDPRGEHLERLRSEFMPLAALTAVDHDSPEYNERNKKSVFYAESWALYHYLQLGQKQKYSPLLPRFVESLLSGVPFDRACAEQLGVSMAALESELRRYLGNDRFQHFEVVSLNPSAATAYGRLGQLRADAEDLDEALILARQAVQLAPARDDFVLRLARVLIMRGETKGARNMLGPLAARGSTPAIKQGARNYLGIAARVELAVTAGGEAPCSGTASDATGRARAAAGGCRTTTSDLGGRRPGSRHAARAPATEEPTIIPDLHHVRDDEGQVFGTMTAIECEADRVILVVQTSSGAVRLWSEAIDRIDFVSFRADYSGSVNCGPQAQPAPMLFTYRPEREGNTIGDVLIVGVVPRGYKPKAP